ncbi:hypothetical protein PHYBLDRAFT_170975 [Phycomyces blakesleeanus NRRL 1555(-)]|uniref:Uncharacterized protein n=2 Tax=Phycomyces blakesleeanus TaxID=4837 RepID=A0A163A3U9_PHYB8|nr:hypothetical protein PHYBLDRAFT_170975 [Phycomyces blakesleeanus NRRL 1555(-)]OAD70891.1 hypothetical protein PHYBLDRAFT_170975 [Phycomyces blakesleeanus NRRL 1555(-)]|eukprot:XP_018288931.1 hypothetical protein PHYBLDRAFT_170975 [Phycomyces blakesleeanus NRRL 1555(-)]
MFTSKLPIISILQTVLLGYISHVVTIRPRTGVSKFPTGYRRFIALVYPSSGIGLAVESMYKSFFGDKILKISQYKPLLKSYAKEETNKPKKDINRIPLNSSKPASQDSSPLIKPSTLECENDKEIVTKDTRHYTDFSSATCLKDRLLKDMKNKGCGHTEAAYLAAFLHIMGPEKAKQIKHCILNCSITVGVKDEPLNEIMYPYCKTEELVVNGPGAACKYQKKARPDEIHLMTDTMINQLETAHNMDDTSYIEVFVTIGQLFYTTVECMDIDGDRWAKVIIIIYTIMSVLQTSSLLLLHKQIAAFSIYEDRDEALILSLSKEYKASVEGAGSTSSTKNNNSSDKCNHKHDYYDGLVTGLSILAGIIVFVFIGIWADYNSHSLTEWLVLSWILSPIVFCPFLIPYFILYMCAGPFIDIYTYENFLEIPIAFGLFISSGLLLSATIIGYLPK